MVCFDWLVGRKGFGRPANTSARLKNILPPFFAFFSVFDEPVGCGVGQNQFRGRGGSFVVMQRHPVGSTGGPSE